MSGLNMALIKAMPGVLAPLAVQQEVKRRTDQLQLSRTADQSPDEGLDSTFAALQERASRDG